ncbi:MAG: IscS subfamily cysteine desulfurase [Bacteroidetes bacterium]|nr:IscS subfamily cysteine desulfurase [Bacteroidota bacterium]
MKFPVYMDYNATTPVDPEVLKEMLPYFCENFGNASSANHKYGWTAEEGVSLARKRVADLINAVPREIIFTGGSTEANNVSLKGVAEHYQGAGNHIITCTSEHKAILETCEYLESRGFEVTYLEVDGSGLIDTEELRNSINDRTILVSIMAANNEIGTIQPVEEIGRICKEKKVLFHTDATQAVGKIPVDVNKMNIDLMSISAHKFYGPKGIGALYVRSKDPRVSFTKQMHGGSQEKGLRGGTLNVPGIVGMGKACEISMNIMDTEMKKHIAYRDKIIDRLLKMDDVHLNGHRTQRLTNNINISIGNINLESLLGDLKDIALSTGSACTSASMAPSHVLSAIGREDSLARNSIRISFGRFTSEEEIDFLTDKLTGSILKLREEAPEFRITK